MSGPSFETPAPTSRSLTEQEIEVLSGKPQGPYRETIDPAANELSSWYWPGTENLRPQTRVYQIIGRNGEPTGRVVYANNEVAAAALTQETRDVNGNVYLPAAKLVDIIYEP